jgi:microcystin-dependent protein
MSNFVKFILRTGYEKDREKVIYSVGEPVYVSDYKRLFIGDGINYGGVLAANKFLGFASFDLTTNSSGIVSAYRGDLVYDNTSNNLYTLTGTNISSVTSYAKITRNFTADNITTILSETSAISVKPLSLNAGYLNDNSIGRGLEKDPNDLEKVRTKNTSYGGGLEYDIHGKLKISNRGVSNERLSDMPGNHIKGNLGLFGKVEDIPLQDLANVLAPILERKNQTFGIPIGTVIDFAGENPPDGYLLCNGQTFSASEYPELYNVIGNVWGGDGTFFKVPNLERKTTIGSGGVGTNGIDNYLGAIGGSESIILEKENIPSHKHSYTSVVEGDGGVSSLIPIDGNLSYSVNITDDGTADGLNSGDAGRPVSIFQPSAVVHKCIKAF